VNPEVSIVIVSFNTRLVLRRCLASIYEFTQGVSFEVIVVDNASADGSAELVRLEFPLVTLLQNERNMGFAAGQNRGLQAACGQYLLVLNSDIIFSADSISTLVAYLKEASPGIGAIGPRVLNSDGSLAVSARKNHLSTVLIAFSVTNRHFPYSQWVPQEFLRKTLGPLLSKVHDNFSRHDAIKSVEYVDGMCCLLKRSVLEQVGLFDEQFFFDFEILDLSNRIRSVDWRIVYYPGTTVTHLKHSSRRKVRRIVIETTRSEFIYYAKYFPKQVRPLRWITRSVVGARMLWNRLAHWVRPNENRAAEYDVLQEVVTVARTFRSAVVHQEERIPTLKPQAKVPAVSHRG
jgi:GT2 family glycosyltransferase